MYLNKLHQVCLYEYLCKITSLWFYLESALNRYFERLECDRPDNNCAVMICRRKDHFPALFIRSARYNLK